MATKDTCAQRLMTVQNNYLLGLASVVLLGNDVTRQALRTAGGDFCGFAINFDKVEPYFALPGQSEDSIRSLALLHLSSLVKDGFELTRHHAKVANKLQQMHAERWFQFARMIRNCIAHSFLFEFNSYDLKVLPVTWRGITIDASMQSTELSLSMFGWAQAWQLFVDIRTFAEQSKI